MPRRVHFSWSALLLPLGAAVIIVAAVCGFLYLREANQVEKNVLDREERRVEIFTGLFSGDLRDAMTDLRELATGDKLQDYLQSGQQSDLDRTTQRAAFFCRENPDYDQIRFLDDSGQEVFRVNANGAVVPHDKLQNKADRPYFQKAMQLAAGQIYLSAFDLNIENGKLEKPLKPILRFAVPIFDEKGRRRGIYIINYLGENALLRLQNFLPQYQQRLRVLNAQGYWLRGATPDEEWGFVLPGRGGMTLAQEEPALWAQIVAQPEGQVPRAGGYFTWRRVILRDIGKEKELNLVTGDDYLILASQMSSQEWAASFVGLRQTFVVIAFILLILSTISIWIFRARLRAKQERDRFFNLTRDLLCIAGFDGYFKRLNSAWQKTLGYSEKELLSMPLVEFIHPDDRAKTIAESERLTHGGETVSFENRYRCKDGSYRWLLWSARSLVAEQLIFASARDMTERKQIEETLRQNEERTRLMVESVKDYAISMLDPSGRVVTWNSGAERIKGYTAEEIVGQHFSRFYPEEAIRDGLVERILDDATTKGVAEDEGWRVRKDGTRFWADVVLSAVHSTSGELLGFVKVTRDITKRKESDERIQKLNEELKQRADLLEAANKELEAFSYSVSHDLRAPLRHIHGFVELLQKAPAIQNDEASRRQTGIIAKAAKDMGMLIDDLLAFSRTGRAEMHPTRVDMKGIVEDIVKSREMESNGRKITWEIEPLSRVTGDPSLLGLVWTNLLDNAIKYTGRCAEARIKVGQLIRGEAPSEAREIVFYIRDNGVGFDMQYASKLFGVFQRLHRAADFDGTGIGLANVQRIVHRHGGRVWAEAKVDEGATFYFSLPMNPPDPG